MNCQKKCLLICGLLLSGWMCGCNKDGDEEIRKYSIPKTKAVYQANHVDPKSASEAKIARKEKVAPVRASKEKNRMLAAIVPDGETLITFKMTGPDSRLKPLIEPFGKMLASLNFEGTKPGWNLPEGWRKLDDSDRENNGFIPRMATMYAGPGADAPRITVTRITRQVGEEQAILENVDRWRGQLSLEPIADITKLYTDKENTKTEQEVRKMTVNERDITLVSLIGYPKAR